MAAVTPVAVVSDTDTDPNIGPAYKGVMYKGMPLLSTFFPDGSFFGNGPYDTMLVGTYKTDGTFSVTKTLSLSDLQSLYGSSDTGDSSASDTGSDATGGDDLFGFDDDGE